jgi:hypothetical protein
VTIRYDAPSSITIFPNPAKEVVNIQLRMPAGGVFLQLIDASGRTLKTLQLSSSGSTLSTTVDVSGLARGLYYIRAGSEVLSFVRR